MSKLLAVISCPIDSYSGYGERSRDFVKSLIKVKGSEWDIRILSQRWGSTSMGYLKDHEENDLKNRIIPQLFKKPQIWGQITIPNEFQKIGDWSVGISAIVETNICDPSWIEGCNRMDLVLVSSNHSKNVLLSSKFEKKDNNTGQIVGLVEITTPVEVLLEGLDSTKFYKIEDYKTVEKTDVVNTLDNVTEDFCFLFAGHWLQGALGEDRKNVGMTIKVFLETFKNKKNPPALVLKTSGGISSIMDKEQILKKIDDVRKTVKGTLPNVYLLHGEIENKDMNNLYNHPKIKAMINLTKGEGYGRPLLEFSIMKKPIVVSGWSGHMDFLDPEFVMAVKGELKPVHSSAVIPNMILAESQWFTPDYALAGIYLKDVYENYDKYTDKVKRQAYKSKSQFSIEKMEEKLEEIITLKMPNIPKPLTLRLPSIKKISLPQPVNV